MAEYSPITEKFGNLTAICPDCNAIMNRRVNLARVRELLGNIDISYAEVVQQLIESPNPSVNSDIK